MGSLSRRPLSAKLIADLQDAETRRRPIPQDDLLLRTSNLGTSFDPQGGGDDRGFWALLGTETSAAVYDFQQVIYSSTGPSWPLATLTGSAPEVNGVTGLAGKVAWIPNIEGDYGFVFRQQHSCPGDGPNTICVSAWSIQAMCALIASDTTGCPTGFPGGLSGVAVVITRVNPTTLAETAFTSGETDETGRVCFDAPHSIDAPTDAPTVDPVGGGTSGGTLPLGTYATQVTYRNAWGETTPSPASAAYQIGIPNPSQYPTLATPTLSTPVLGSSGLLLAGTYYARIVYRDAAGHHNTPTGSSPAIVVATLGDIPRIDVADFALRDFATGFDVYLATTLTGTYHLYLSAQTTITDLPLDAVYSAATAAAPSTNTSLLNIPRVTFTPGGDITRIYAEPAGSDGVCHYVESATSTKDITGTLVNGVCPPAHNTTGWGLYKVCAHPTDCNMQCATVNVTGYCNTYELAFGFCCWGIDLTVTDHDSGDPLTPTIVCGGGCTDESGVPVTPGELGGGEIVGVCKTGDPCSNQTWLKYIYCGSLAGSTTHCRLTLEGYWDRCISVPTPCDVPAAIAAGAATMYSKALWVQYDCCGICNDINDPDRVPSMIPKTLFTTVTGPDAVIGGGGSRTLTLTYDDVRLVWSSGCVDPSGAYGRNWIGGVFYWPFGIQDPYTDGPDCDPPFTDQYWTDTHGYSSSRCDLVLSGPGCAQYLQWTNYWNGSCTSPDPDPIESVTPPAVPQSGARPVDWCGDYVAACKVTDISGTVIAEPSPGRSIAHTKVYGTKGFIIYLGGGDCKSNKVVILGQIFAPCLPINCGPIDMSSCNIIYPTNDPGLRGTDCDPSACASVTE